MILFLLYLYSTNTYHLESFETSMHIQNKKTFSCLNIRWLYTIKVYSVAFAYFNMFRRTLQKAITYTITFYTRKERKIALTI